MKAERILALRCALLIAYSEALKLKDVDDGGTCNFDTPTLKLTSEWKEADVNEAFKLTGLRPYKVDEDYYHVLGAVEGQGFRRTAMAQAFRDCLVELGYNSHVYYQMD